MFIERLTSEDIKKYLVNNTPCDNDVEVIFSNGKSWRVLNYIETKRSGKRVGSIHLTDFNFNHIYNKNWCLYLYSLFGEEYLKHYEEIALKAGMPELK